MPIYRLSLPFGPSSPLLSPFHRSFHTHYLVSSQTLKQWPYTLERSTIPGLLIILSQRAWANWVSCRQRWGSNGSQHLWDSDSVNLGWDLATWYFKNSSVTQIICLIWEPWCSGYRNPPACPIHSTSWAFAATDPSYHPQNTPGHSETLSPPLEFGLEIWDASQPLLAL